MDTLLTEVHGWRLACNPSAHVLAEDSEVVAEVELVFPIHLRKRITQRECGCYTGEAKSAGLKRYKTPAPRADGGDQRSPRRAVMAVTASRPEKEDGRCRIDRNRRPL